MNDLASHALEPDALLRVLEVTRQLAAPRPLPELLTLVIEAGRQVLGVDRGTVFLFDRSRNELNAHVATGQDSIRFGIDKGIAGQCARDRQVINVADAYADPRFNPEIDRQTGYRTRCLLTLPLVGLEEELVGVMQLLNPASGVFTETLVHVAQVLAAQAAVAIQRTRLLDERLLRLKLERDLKIAQDIQQKVLPRELPHCPGYGIAAFSQACDQTGGDLYDLVDLNHAPAAEGSPAPHTAGADARDLLVVLADASGHGIGPALSVTQFRAMLRMGLRLSTDLDQLVHHINRQLHDDLPDGRFITAFFGVLDPQHNTLRYHSAGQGPLLHYRSAARECRWCNPSCLPLAVLPHLEVEPPAPIRLEPGDWMVLLTDGFYEYQNAAGKLFGRERVAEVVDRHRARTPEQMLQALRDEVAAWAGGAAQVDDLTAVLIRRDPARA